MAEKDAAKCVELYPTFAKGYARLANAQRHLGKKEDALASLAKGAQLDSGNAEINRLTQEMRKEAKSAEASSSSSALRQPRDLPPAVSKELEELQPQMRNISRELGHIGMRLQRLTRDRKRCELTRRDISGLPQDSNMYQSVGKMFLHMTFDETKSHLSEQESTINNQVATLESRKTYLERQQLSLEQNIRELLSQCMK